MFSFEFKYTYIDVVLLNIKCSTNFYIIYNLAFVPIFRIFNMFWPGPLFESNFSKLKVQGLNLPRLSFTSIRLKKMACIDSSTYVRDPFRVQYFKVFF